VARKRGRLYELIVNCIPAEVILKKLVKELMRKLDAELKHEVGAYRGCIGDV